MDLIAETNVFLRAQIKLPKGLKLVTQQFRGEWKFARSESAMRLQDRIHALGWNFIKIDDGSLGNGVGNTPQEAIARALRMALCRICEPVNALEVEDIELTQYPWFFLARVGVRPYCIQQGAHLPARDEAESFAMPRGRGRPTRKSMAKYPHFASSMASLRQALVITSSSLARHQ
jgi:hypothetical protein